MTQGYAAPASDLSWHIHFLGRIYTILGWLGLIGSGFLLFAIMSAETVPNGGQAGLFGISPELSVFLLVCWSILLLNFAKDLALKQQWSTGVGGVVIGVLHLFSLPVGTAVGLYTLWILFRHHRR